MLSLSDGQTKTIIALLAGPMDLAALSGAVCSDRSTTIHFTAKPRKEGMIVRTNGLYSLTSIGRLHAMLLHSIVTGKAAIEENKAFWEGHDVSSIPDDLLAEIGLLVGCQCVQDNGLTVMKSLANFISLMEQAKDFRGVSSVIAPGHAELISGLLNSGATVELILSKSIVALLPPDTLRYWKECDSFQLYEMPDACHAAFAVTEDILSLGLYLPDGHYDTNQDLICKGAGAVKWGRKLFEHYKGMAKVVK